MDTADNESSGEDRPGDYKTAYPVGGSRSKLDYYADLLENAPIAYQSLDANGRIRDVNDYWCSLLGYHRSEVIGRAFAEFIPSPFLQTFRSSFRKFKSHGSISDREFDLVSKSGKILTVSFDGQVQCDSCGDFICTHCIMRDLTDQRRAEAESRDYSVKLSSFIECSDSILVLHDLDGNYLYFNGPSVFGVDQESIVGKSVRDLFSNEEAERLIEQIREVASSRRALQAENSVEWDGDRLWFLDHVYPVIDDDDEVRRVGKVCLNITALKKKDLLLEEANSRLRTIIDSVKRSFVLLDSDYSVIMANGVAKDTTRLMLGREISAGDAILEIIPLSDRGDFESYLRSAYKGKSVTIDRMRINDYDEKNWYRFSFHPVGTDKGGTSCVCLMVEDVTYEHRYLTEVSRLDKLESVGGLAAGIAHEFNNVLSGIVGSLSLLKTDLDIHSDGYAIAMEAEKSAARARRLTEQLITFSRGGHLVKSACLVADIVDEALEYASLDSSINVKREIAGDIWSVAADSSQLAETFLNLLLNAEQAMPVGGYVTITGRNIEIDSSSGIPLDDGRYVSISVADSGVGISADKVDRIFDPFYSTKKLGHGLGLTASYAIVRRHGGHITVESTPYLGSRFTVYLPASIEPANRNEILRDLRAQSACRILFIDNEPAMCRFARLTLSSLGYDVTIVSDALEGISMLETAVRSGVRYDLVILDVDDPDCALATETLRKLKNLDSNVPVLATCHDPDAHLLRDYDETGFSGALAKPYSVYQLGSEVSRVTARS